MSIIGLGGGQSKIDYAAQQRAAREAEQAKQLAADRAEKLASANESRDAEATRLKRLRGDTGATAVGTGELAQVETAGLKTKLGQ